MAKPTSTSTSTPTATAAPKPLPFTLSVVIPAYNEEPRIKATLDAARAYLNQRRIPYEIIVVDDGSTDATVEAVRAYAKRRANITLLQNQVNAGKGAAAKKGVLASRKNWILVMDADGTLRINELDTFLGHLDSDVIIGSKALGRSQLRVRQPWYRSFLGRTFNLFVRMLAVRGVHDTQCGFKLFRTRAAQKIFKKQTIDRFGYDVEILYLAQKQDLRIVELPIHLVQGTQTSVRFFTDALAMVRDIIKIRWNDILGRY